MKLMKILLATVLSLPAIAMAIDDYPDKPVRIIVPFAPGGGVDNFARPLAETLSEQLGQSVIIENRAGGGGVIGGAVAARSKPDGYTLLASTDTSMHLTTVVLKTTAFDPLRDLTPIISAAITPTVFVVHPSLPIHTMKDLVDYAKKSGQPVPYATAGAGSLHHLTGESLAMATGIKLLHVGYKGGSPAVADLLAGQVKVGIIILSSIAQHIQSGKLRALAVIEGHRSKLFPDIPTIAESGVPGFAMPDTSIALWGPAGTPQSIVRKINAEVQKAMQTPRMREAMAKGGYEATPGTSASFEQQAKRSYAAYQAKVKETGLSAE